MLTTVKHKLVDGKYFIQVAPKRPLTSFILFNADARKKLPQPKQGQKVNFVQVSKTLAKQWKALASEEKAKYKKIAQELQKQYQIEKAKYYAKFVQPFKKVNYHNLLIKEFYSKNKFTNLAVSLKALQAWKLTLKEQDLEKYKKEAEQINKANSANIKKYEVPTPEFKDFNDYLRHLKKIDPNIPLKSKIQPSKLVKYEKQYQQQKMKFTAQFQNFAKSFSIKVKDLAKLVNKNKDPSEKLDQQGRSLKDQYNQIIKKAALQLKMTKQQLLKTLQMLKYSQLKKMNKNVEKSKKGIVRAQNKLNYKVIRVNREKQELKIQKNASKKLNIKDKQIQQHTIDLQDGSLQVQGQITIALPAQKKAMGILKKTKAKKDSQQASQIPSVSTPVAEAKSPKN